MKENLIKALREELDKNDAEEGDDDVVEVTEVVEERPESVVRMNKDTTHNTCNACNKKFRTSQDLENHVQSKHVEKKGDYCDNIFSNEHELGKHHKECDKVGVANKVCNKCNKSFTTNGIKRHAPTCHVNNDEFDCPDCGMIFNNANDVKTHRDKDHTMEPVRSREEFEV